MRIEIEGYIVQSKLEKALRQIVSSSWLGRELKVPGTRYRWDMAFKRGGKTVVVEFDGDRHYQDTRTICADREKDSIAMENGFRVVRFPYWVQLTTQTLEHYFGLKADIAQDFAHGFISPKARLPASFCELGVKRFREEMDALPVNVKSDVIRSLSPWIHQLGVEYVVPSTISGWFSEEKGN